MMSATVGNPKLCVLWQQSKNRWGPKLQTFTELENFRNVWPSFVNKEEPRATSWPLLHIINHSGVSDLIKKGDLETYLGKGSVSKGLLTNILLIQPVQGHG